MISRGAVIHSAEESMRRLGTDYLDILLLHDIEFGSLEQVVEEGVPALEQLKNPGKSVFSAYPACP